MITRLLAASLIVVRLSSKYTEFTLPIFCNNKAERTTEGVEEQRKSFESYIAKYDDNKHKVNRANYLAEIMYMT